MPKEARDAIGDAGLLRLAATEMKLFVREPLVLIFVFAFPVLTVLVLGGVRGGRPGLRGGAPSDYYVAAYIAVVIAAIGLVMLPVHLASYRERGVLRRFEVSRYPRWALPAAWILVAMATTAVAVAVLLVVGGLVYGLPEPDDLLGVIVGTALGAFAFISVGIALGMALPSARSAQGLGLLLFFPFFLLGGGARPEAMGEPPELDLRDRAPHPRGALGAGALARSRQPRHPPGSAGRSGRGRHRRLGGPGRSGRDMRPGHLTTDRPAELVVA